MDEILLLLFGIPACAAIVVAGIAWIIYVSIYGPGLTISDAGSSALFVVGALVVLAVSFRAYRRVRRRRFDGSEGFVVLVARIVPFLVVAGVGLGGAFSWYLITDVRRQREDSARSLCSRVLPPDATQARFEACIPIAVSCEREVSSIPNVPVKRGVDPSNARPLDEPFEHPRDADAARCVLDRMGGGRHQPR